MYINQKITIIKEDGSEDVISDARIINIEIEDGKEIMIPLRRNVLHPNSLTVLCGQHGQKMNDYFALTSWSLNNLHIFVKSISDDELSKLVKDNNEYLENYP
ncbi:hypothetical protein [Chryseobacterium sp. MEBOG07]|uniref:hypothetical protein n=1 Tax=Chryseobacterium sp. MEBOG07 TaxID=2879939 RepID=UPI001F3576B4|nr:hypothetical protein [Chryseobacterium sp. MEBOG07]UKB78340.1 hypothetical protein LF886_17915 [Chryseobacterium sp. MEBOG07]